MLKLHRGPSVSSPPYVKCMTVFLTYTFKYDANLDVVDFKAVFLNIFCPLQSLKANSSRNQLPSLQLVWFRGGVLDLAHLTF